MPATMVIYEDRIEWNFAETAYWWLHYGGYGSEAKALKALRRRKGMGHLDEATIAHRFAVAVAIYRRTEELIEAEIERGGHVHLYQVSEQEHKDGTVRMETVLREEFPGAEDTADYMVGMLWDMPYVR